jgi:GMP synthase (glutamine-hydrolysing)
MILIIDCGSSKSPYIGDAVDLVCDYKIIGLFDEELKQIIENNFSSFKGIIISGAPIIITEVPLEKYSSLFSFIKTVNIPILGICFGHQMIGLQFGAFASRQKEDRDWQTIEVIEESSLFNKLPSEVKMMEDHCECISIPPKFKLIACSDACVNEMMQHETKFIFGVQFHPEVSGNHGFIFIENFVNICLDN